MRVVSALCAHTVVFGFLSGAIRPDTIFPSVIIASVGPPAQIATWCAGAESVLAAVPAPGSTAAQAALRFCLSFPNGFDGHSRHARPPRIERMPSQAHLVPLPRAAIEAVLTAQSDAFVFSCEVGWSLRPLERDDFLRVVIRSRLWWSMIFFRKTGIHFLDHV